MQPFVGWECFNGMPPHRKLEWPVDYITKLAISVESISYSSQVRVRGNWDAYCFYFSSFLKLKNLWVKCFKIVGFPQRGYNLWQGGTTRGQPQRGHTCGFVQDSKNTQVYREDEFYDPQGQWFDHQRRSRNQGGQRGGFRGFQSKPKSKLKDRGRDKERGEWSSCGCISRRKRFVTHWSLKYWYVLIPLGTNNRHLILIHM